MTDHGPCACVMRINPRINPRAAVAADLASLGDGIAVAPGTDECRCEMCRLTGPVEADEYRCTVCHDIGVRSDAHGTRQRPVCVRCEPCEVCTGDEGAPWPCMLAVWGDDRHCCGDCAGRCTCRTVEDPESGEAGCLTHGCRR